MKTKDQTIILTRTAPMYDFIPILYYTEFRFPHSSLLLLLQNSIKGKYKKFEEYKCIYFPDGPFILKAAPKELICLLKKEQIDVFIITSNTPDFSGYEEWQKLAQLTGATKINMVRSDLTEKK
jgi:hypothetical protein